MFISLRERGGKERSCPEKPKWGLEIISCPECEDWPFCSWKSYTRLARTVKASQRLLANFDLPELPERLVGNAVARGR